MSESTITVYHHNNGMLVYEAVAIRLGLHHGQCLLTDAHFWQVLEANALYGIETCTKAIEEQKMIEGVEKWMEANTYE